MNSRARTAGLALVLGALVCCAFGAAGASAEGEKGLTAVKCAETGPGSPFKTSQCITGEGGGNFATVELEKTNELEGTATQNSHKLGNTEEPVLKFMMSVGGITTTLTCGKGKITGKVTNTLEGEIHRAHGTENVVTFEECHASKTTDTTKQCKVKQAGQVAGTIVTNKLTTTNIGVHHELEIKPETPETFVEFEIEKSSTPTCFTVVNIPVKVTGKIKADANTETHNHITLTTTTNGTEFKANGAEAMVETTLTGWLKGSEEKSALGLTTATPTE
jgi:hypothetical protein